MRVMKGGGTGTEGRGEKKDSQSSVDRELTRGRQRRVEL